MTNGFLIRTVFLANKALVEAEYPDAGALLWLEVPSRDPKREEDDAVAG